MFRQFFFLTLMACAFAIQLPHPIRDDDDGAKACEYCSGSASCRDGLACEKNTCERLAKGSPRCAPSERCGSGRRRICRAFRPEDRDDFGQLKRDMIEKGFFIGRTSLVRRCVDGLKRFGCYRKSSVCRNNFCITFTLLECESRGLVVGKVNESNQFSPCCVYVLPRDCYAVELCRCASRDDDDSDDDDSSSSSSDDD